MARGTRRQAGPWEITKSCVSCVQTAPWTQPPPSPGGLFAAPAAPPELCSASEPRQLCHLGSQYPLAQYAGSPAILAGLISSLCLPCALLYICGTFSACSFNIYKRAQIRHDMSELHQLSRHVFTGQKTPPLQPYCKSHLWCGQAGTCQEAAVSLSLRLLIILHVCGSVDFIADTGLSAAKARQLAGRHTSAHCTC